MKKLITLISLAFITHSFAGPEATPSPTPVVIDQHTVIELAEGAVAHKNFSIVVYPSYAPKLNGGAWGAGIAGLYQINAYSFTGLRMDILDHNYFAASAAIGLKADVTVFGHVFTPMAYGGIISPISGAGDEKAKVGAIVGTGIQTLLLQTKDEKMKLHAFGSVEEWPGIYSGIQILHVGVMGSISF